MKRHYAAFAGIRLLPVDEQCELSDRFDEDLAPHCLSRPRESPVQIGCRADQREVRECLGKISKMSPIRTQFL